MVGKLACVGPFFIPMQLPSVPRHQRMHACWLDPKRSQDLGRRSLAPFFPLAKIIFQKKSLYFGSSVWVWLRFGAGDRSAQGISAVTCRGLPTRVQTARAFALCPRPCAASVRALRRANFKASSSNRCRSMPSSMQSQQQRASGSGSSVLPSPNRCSLFLSPLDSATQLCWCPLLEPDTRISAFFAVTPSSFPQQPGRDVMHGSECLDEGEC